MIKPSPIDVVDLNSNVCYTINAVAILLSELVIVSPLPSDDAGADKLNSLHHALNVLIEKAASEADAVTKALETMQDSLRRKQRENQHQIPA